MTCQRFHTVSRMRENCTYGSMRGQTYPAGASRPTLHTLERVYDGELKSLQSEVESEEMEW